MYVQPTIDVKVIKSKWTACIESENVTSVKKSDVNKYSSEIYVSCMSDNYKYKNYAECVKSGLHIAEPKCKKKECNCSYTICSYCKW